MTVGEFFKNKWTIIAIALLVIAGAVTATVLLVLQKDYMTIRALAGNDIEQNRVADYDGSRLDLYDNGTFAFKVVYQGANEFVGIGTYKESGKTYIFTYKDMFRRIGTELRRDDENANGVFTYNDTKKGLELKCPNNRIYYFK